VDVIQDVGAYAGFAAVVGLAVLSALYFSQSRDVRRLREWAGRAPERAAEQAAAQQTVGPEQAAQQASRPAPSGAVKPIPAAKPGVAKPGAAPGKPAPAGAPPVPATVAATAAKPAAPGAASADGPPSPASTGPAPATPAGKPGAPKEADKEKETDTKEPDGAKEPEAPVQPAAGPAPAPAPAARPKPPPVLPARPAPPVRSPAAASSTGQSTAVLPPSARLRDRARGGGDTGDRLSPRYIALIVAGVIVIGGGVVFGISQLGGDEESGTSADQTGDQVPQAPVNPSTVTVSVLNGTTVPGLAAQIGDEVESAGFQRGNVANAIDQQRASSVVMYAEGADREAKLVARRLGINAVEPVDPDSQALGGTASVVVIVGSDQTS
jgi:hypothetical protein